MFITVFLVIPSDHTQINWYTKRGVLAALYGSTGRLKITILVHLDKFVFVNLEPLQRYKGN